MIERNYNRIHEAFGRHRIPALRRIEHDHGKEFVDSIASRKAAGFGAIVYSFSAK